MKKMNNSVSELSQQASNVRLHFENIKRKGVIYMKKMKHTQKVALILLFATLFALLAGCTTPANPTDPTVTDPTVTDPTMVTDPTVPNRVLFNGQTDLFAITYADCKGYSLVYELEITVEDGKVYVCDKEYYEMPHDNFEIIHTTGYFKCADNEVKAADFFDMLNKIEMHCLLETESQSVLGKQIAVYEIDGRFYFLSFYDSCEVCRVHVSVPMKGE